VVFTGLRPGEKLHEELVAPGERVSDTRVPKVKLLGAADEGLDSPAIRSLLSALGDDDLERALHRFHVSYPLLGSPGGQRQREGVGDAQDPAVVLG
jgi:hypothetical protein